MEVMSPLDSAFLRMETANTSLHIASLAIFEGPAPSYDELYDLIARKLVDLPRYTQRVREVPLWLGRPVWVEDPNLNLHYHLRHTVLPRPGGDDELRTLMARLMSAQLDRSRPLWEEWLIEGLAGGRWALVGKVHHCMVDGVAGTDVLSKLLDAERSPVREPFIGQGIPYVRSEPSQLRLLGSALTSLPHRPVQGMRSLADSVVHPGRSYESASLLARGALSWTRLAKPAESSSLTGSLGRARAWDFTSTTFDDIKAVRAAYGGSFNDVVVSAIARGFRDLLLERGERPGAHAVRTLIPVSVRGGSEGVANEVSAMIADLPVDACDPVARYQAVSAELSRLKESGEIQLGELMADAGGWTAPLLLSLGLTSAFRLPHRHLVTVATNVPGPRIPLYAAGRQLLELYPYVPIADRMRIGVAMTSYNRILTFGVTADAASTPDLPILTAGIAEGMRELVEAATGVTRPAASKRARARAQTA
jgi:WS/DGAT/MGAT family acyltransferase